MSEISSEIKTWFNTSLRIAMDHFQKYIQENNLTLTQMNLLFHLYYLGPREMTGITDLLDTTRSAVSQLVDRMVAQELLERVENPDDRRSRELRLTPKAVALVEGGIHARQNWFEELCSNLPGPEQQEVSQALHTLNRVFLSSQNSLS
jgi:DNA-binding MarR family transcriptional regulator